jgi:murein L,D-transpeptidase YcbB/YkuD
MTSLHLLSLLALAAGPPTLALELNLPAYRLDVLRDGVVVSTYPVTIGKRTHPTPTGRYTIRTVEWNPWWHPPDSDWARGREITPPGPANPMGRAKLVFRPLYFIHGTTEPRSIGTAASHGCVRMRNADVVALGLLLAGGERVPARTRLDRLSAAVPLTIRYERVEIRADHLELHPDPYRLGGDLRARATELLAGSGMEDRVTPAELRRALAELARTGRSVRVRLARS